MRQQRLQYRRFSYIGPEKIRKQTSTAPSGIRVTNGQTLQRWLKGDSAKDDDLWATYTISVDCTLTVASRRSEHVACAEHGEVLGAGEIQFEASGNVCELTNYSTGYCPDLLSIHAVSAALDGLGWPISIAAPTFGSPS
jgi:hypothetical protein